MTPFTIFRRILTGETTTADAKWLAFWWVVWTVLITLLIIVTANIKP